MMNTPAAASLLAPAPGAGMTLSGRVAPAASSQANPQAPRVNARDGSLSLGRLGLERLTRRFGLLGGGPTRVGSALFLTPCA